MTHILLLRGINVGGSHKLPMKELTAILTSLGASDVRTYIASGNAVFSGEIAAVDIEDAIESAKGFRPRALILTGDQLRLIAQANPYPAAEAEGKTLHVWFASRPPEFDDAAAQALKKDNEQFHVSARAIYLWAPDGIGRSKLAEKIEKLAGVPATARNWNTVKKLLEMTAD